MDREGLWVLRDNGCAGVSVNIVRGKPSVDERKQASMYCLFPSNFLACLSLNEFEKLTGRTIQPGECAPLTVGTGEICGAVAATPDPGRAGERV